MIQMARRLACRQEKLMSMELFVFLCDDRLPSRDEWQRALDAYATGIELVGIDDLRSHSGFLPAKFGADWGQSLNSE